jgi:hypothetical protein
MTLATYTPSYRLFIPFIYLRSILILSSHRHLSLQSGIFSEMFHPFCISTMRAVCFTIEPYAIGYKASRWAKIFSSTGNILSEVFNYISSSLSLLLNVILYLLNITALFGFLIPELNLTCKSNNSTHFSPVICPITVWLKLLWEMCRLFRTKGMHNVLGLPVFWMHKGRTQISSRWELFFKIFPNNTARMRPADIMELNQTLILKVNFFWRSLLTHDRKCSRHKLYLLILAFLGCDSV